MRPGWPSELRHDDTVPVDVEPPEPAAVEAASPLPVAPIVEVEEMHAQIEEPREVHPELAEPLVVEPVFTPVEITEAGMIAELQPVAVIHDMPLDDLPHSPYYVQPDAGEAPSIDDQDRDLAEELLTIETDYEGVPLAGPRTGATT